MRTHIHVSHVFEKPACGAMHLPAFAEARRGSPDACTSDGGVALVGASTAEWHRCVFIRRTLGESRRCSRFALSTRAVPAVVRALVREYLSGVQNPVGIERRLEPALQRDQLSRLLEM